jgi:hypothetical protein
MTARFASRLIAVLILIKCLQFWLDSQGLVQYDSGGFLANAHRRMFIPCRSPIYSFLFLRPFVLPFGSLTVLVAAQMAAGVFTAAVLALGLARHGGVNRWLAAAAAVAFVCDPVQVMYEHLLMSEAVTLALEAAFF